MSGPWKPWIVWHVINIIRGKQISLFSCALSYEMELAKIKRRNWLVIDSYTESLVLGQVTKWAIATSPNTHSGFKSPSVSHHIYT